MNRGSIFASDDAFEDRLIVDEKVLEDKVRALRTLGLRIVLTSGSFDISHIGHMRYLREARRLGDCLIVGIDSDERVRSRKGALRPIIPERERAEMLAHSRYADIITIKDDGTERWSLIKLVHPDVLVVSKRTDYDEGKQEALKEYCSEIVVLESQATTSTSANVRKLQMETLVPCLTQIRDVVDQMLKGVSGEGSK